VKDPKEIHRLLQEYEASALTQREFAVHAGVASPHSPIGCASFERDVFRISNPNGSKLRRFLRRAAASRALTLSWSGPTACDFIWRGDSTRTMPLALWNWPPTHVLAEFGHTDFPAARSHRHAQEFQWTLRASAASTRTRSPERPSFCLLQSFSQSAQDPLLGWLGIVGLRQAIGAGTLQLAGECRGVGAGVDSGFDLAPRWRGAQSDEQKAMVSALISNSDFNLQNK
jgi:hypothetical protein